MATILATHYHENYKALSAEPVIRRMAADLIKAPPPWPFESPGDGGPYPSPSWDLMMASNAYYRQALTKGQATVEPGSIGAVATAILIAKAEIERANVTTTL